MNKSYEYGSIKKPLFHYTEIPKQLHNITLTEEQRKRMAFGLDSGLIKNMLFEEGQVTDVKLSAVKNEKGDIEISYDEHHQYLRIPKKILGHLLNEEQKNLLLDGGVIGPVTYKGQHYFVGVDEQLNKVTIRTDRQIGIPETIGNYTLDAIDKHKLANGKPTDTRIFQTPKGDFFTAKVLIAENKNGMEFLDVKLIAKENAQALIKELNRSKVITDPEFLLYMPGIPANIEDQAKTIEAPVFEKKIVVIPQKEEKVEKTQKSTLTKERSVQKTVRNQENVVYEQVIGSADSFTINATASFVPKVFKGVALTEQQRRDMKSLKPIKVYGVNTSKGKSDATIQLLKSGGIKINYTPVQKMPGGISKSQPFDKSH